MRPLSTSYHKLYLSCYMYLPQINIINGILHISKSVDLLATVLTFCATNVTIQPNPHQKILLFTFLLL